MESMIMTFDDLLQRSSRLSTKRILVINPANAEMFQAIAEAQKKLPTSFILVGDEEAISRGLNQEGASAATTTIVAAETAHRALESSIGLARDQKADVLMKGSVDTSTMMRTVLQESSGLRTGRLMSDIFILESPERKDNRLMMITDGGMSLSLDLKKKVDLIKNAVSVAHAFGNSKPRVAVLSATEFVLTNLQSTIDAAALAKMNERGQIKGCVVDGPLALDSAVSPEAAEEKGIQSKVAGKADILLAANIESANSLAKSTTYFAGLRLAHVIVGSRIPILIPSRADKSDAKLLSIAAGMLMSEQPWSDD
jgi:phosphate butyryltransferase